MNYSEIKYFDIANGVGVRTTLFVSGCRHHCEGCFNPDQWSFAAGEPFTREVEDKILESLDPTYVVGITLLGGEPMEPENQQVLLPFLERVRVERPGKTIWLFSGFRWEELTGADPGARCRVEGVTDRLLGLLDVLVDGRFVLAQRDISLRFRGSANQRLLDVPASLASGKATWWQDEAVFASRSW